LCGKAANKFSHCVCLCIYIEFFITQFTRSIFAALYIRISWKKIIVLRIWLSPFIWNFSTRDLLLPLSLSLLFSQHNVARFSENLIRRASGWKSLMLAIVKVCAKTVNYAQSYFCLRLLHLFTLFAKMSLVQKKERCIFSCVPLSYAYKLYMKGL